MLTLVRFLKPGQILKLTMNLCQVHWVQTCQNVCNKSYLIKLQFAIKFSVI
jgi:hypothetical protein